jgi:hypothetical protein
VRVASSKVISALAAVMLVAAVATFAWNVFGVSVEVGLAGRISAARASWKAASGGNYRAIVRVIDYNLPTFDNVTVVVKAGKVVEASARPALLANDPSTPAKLMPLDEAATYTIEGLFDYAAAQVADLPGVYFTAGNGYRYSLTINPGLGYIQEFKVDVCGRGPLAAKISECRWGFDVLDVRLDG